MVEEQPETTATGETEAPAAPAGPPTVKLGTMEVKLVAPPSPTVAWEILAHSGGPTAVRGQAAALAVCWNAPRRPGGKNGYLESGYNPLVFGQKVLDELLERGLDFSEIMAAGDAAMTVLSKRVVNLEAVKKVEGFSGAGTGT